MTADAIATPEARPWLRAALIAVAGIETLIALTAFDGMFIDWNHPSTLLRLSQALTTLKIAAAPLLAGMALLFAIKRRLRDAIVTLAALVLATWFAELPSVLIHGLELSASIIGAILFIERLVYPAMAAAAVVLVVRNERLGLAAVLVSLPSIVSWLGALAFAAGIAIHG
jgi:hypothetical protein